MSRRKDEWRWADPTGQQRLVRTDELLAGLTSGAIPPNAPVWKRGWPEWKAAYSVAELTTSALAAANGVVPNIPPPPAEMVAVHRQYERETPSVLPRGRESSVDLTEPPLPPMYAPAPTRVSQAPQRMSYAPAAPAASQAPPPLAAPAASVAPQPPQPPEAFAPAPDSQTVPRAPPLPRLDAPWLTPSNAPPVRSSASVPPPRRRRPRTFRTARKAYRLRTPRRVRAPAQPSPPLR